MAAAARLVLHMAAMMFSLISGVILARRLDAVEYAVYQTLSRRLEAYASLPANIVRFWGYRYVAMRVKGAWHSYVLSLTASATIGIPVAATITAMYDGVLGSLLLLAGLYGFLRIATPRLVSTLEAIRPVRSELIVLIQRGLSTVLVVVLVLVLGTGLWGALVSAIIAMTTAILTTLASSKHLLREPICWKCIREWFSRRGVLLPLMVWLTFMLYGLDAIYAKILVGADAVAGFFAAILFANIVYEVSMVATRHLYAYLLSGGDYSTVLLTWRATLAMAALPLGYMAARPNETISLLNPAYAFAAQALQLYTINVLVLYYALTLTQILQGHERSRTPVPGGTLWKSITYALASATLFAILYPILVSQASTLAEATLLWALALLLSNIIRTLLLAKAASSITSLYVMAKELVLPTLAYYAIAYLAATLLAPTGVKGVFWLDVETVAKGAIYTTVVYTAIVLVVDKTIRSLAKKAYTQLVGQYWKQPHKP